MTVTTIGNPSGIAATASETIKIHKLHRKWKKDLPAMVNVSKSGFCCHIPIAEIIVIIKNCE